MTYQNDPNRNNRDLRPGEGSGLMIGLGVVGALFLAVLAFALWPSERNRTAVSDTSTRTERSTTPAPATPPGAKPQTDLKPKNDTAPAKTPAQ